MYLLETWNQGEKVSFYEAAPAVQCSSQMPSDVLYTLPH